MSPIQRAFKRVRKLLGWSYSRYQDYRECPAKAAYKHVDKLSPYAENTAQVDRLIEERAKGKIKELPNGTEPMIKGSVVHGLAELVNKGLLQRIPAELATFKKEFQQMKKYKVINEKQWAFRSDWTPTDWFSKDAWLRVMVDSHFDKGNGSFEIIDYKTGKAPITDDAYYLQRKIPKPVRGNPMFDFWNTQKFNQHEEQRELYAIATFIMYPDAVVVKASHWYTDAGVEYYNTYTRVGHFEKLKKKWEKATRAMMSDTTFAPRPSSSACKFCPFKASNGGPCKY